MTYKELEEKAGIELPARVDKLTATSRWIRFDRVAQNDWNVVLCHIGANHPEAQADAMAALLAHCVNHFGAVVEALEKCLVYDCKRSDAPLRKEVLSILAAATNIPDMGKEGK